MLGESSRPDSDAQLARRILGRRERIDRDAEHELCARLAPRIRAYGLKHLRDEVAADDLVQESLIVVLSALREERLESPDSLASFVFSTCRNIVSDGARRTRRREGLLARHDEELHAPAVEPLDVARLHHCLDTLTHLARRVLVMTFFQDATGDEIAEATTLAPGNVRVTRHRSLAKLRDCLEGGGAPATADPSRPAQEEP